MASQYREDLFRSGEGELSWLKINTCSFTLYALFPVSLWRYSTEGNSFARVDEALRRGL